MVRNPVGLGAGCVALQMVYQYIPDVMLSRSQTRQQLHGPVAEVRGTSLEVAVIVRRVRMEARSKQLNVTSIKRSRISI
jgi:hypothetical protein